MSVTDAFVVGEDWIGEHYFGSDAKSQSFHARLLALRKEWDAAAVDDEPNPRSRVIAARGALEAALARIPSPDDTGVAPSFDLDAITASVTQPLLAALGYVDGATRTVRADGPVRWVTAAGDEHPSLAIVAAKHVEAPEALLAKDTSTLVASYEKDGEKPIVSVARLLSRIFLAEHAPPFALATAGSWMLLAEQERWAEGRYLAIDVQAVLSRNDAKRAGEIDRMVACLAADTVMPSPDGTTWWRETLDDSAKHTVSVSKDLREGVRRSIELIANEVVRRRRARGLEPLPADQAQPLARQSLRYIYRILFLLYAEASPEMGVLPLATGDYEEGYSLDRLRDLLLVPIDPDDDGGHLHASLSVLFRLVDDGATQQDVEATDGLQFESLKADLFLPSAVEHIAEVGLGDGALHQVLSMLLLSKEQRGRDRGFISYAELGINQLGAVYEGLMSYTGFFAETHLHEVAKGGDSSKGSWVVPTDRSGDLSSEDFVKREDANGAIVPVVHEPGSFVFRLAGRERQQSASYYTPEVLTRFTVSQALAELLDQDGVRTTAEEVLNLTVCEPALGSGAFAIEATRQLAEEYLKRRQDELDLRLDPDDYPRELQKAKAHIALHNVYGVDLNATAVELAEVSLWLDTMVSGLQAPWFGLHLRRGNSLIGARRAVYSLDAVRKKAWLKEAPRDVPMTSLRADLNTGHIGSGLRGGIHHFLLPAEGWGAGADAKEAKELAPDTVKHLQAWRRSLRVKPTKEQERRLQSLSLRVETLWQFALRRIEIAEREIRRNVDVWGHGEEQIERVSRQAIEAALFHDQDSPYRRLRRVMDAWCAMWFWPVAESDVAPPSMVEWIDGLEMLLGRHTELGARAAAAGQTSIVPSTNWSALTEGEELELGFAGAASVDEVLSAHPWLRLAEEVSSAQGFFHWEVDFASVLAGGGFDLQVGNPPWVRPRTDVEALLAENDPWWQLRGKTPEAALRHRRSAALGAGAVAELVASGTADVASLSAYLGSPLYFPHLAGLQPDLYRCFMEHVWRVAASKGVSSLIHFDTHFTDESAGPFRAANYRRLRRHWEFINELELFEIQNQKHYGVSVFGCAVDQVSFLNAVNMYHPDTVERSLAHDGSGEEPGLKDPDGRWDLRPHASRVVRVDDDVLRSWHDVLEDESVPLHRTRMVHTVNGAVAAVLAKLAAAPRLRELGLQYSRGWDESIDRTKGRFDVDWGPVDDWRDAILQGPHLFVSNPFYKTPNSTMLHHRDWNPVDLEALASDAMPVTSYKPAGDRATYDAAYTHWSTEREPARDHYRVVWRNMAANTGERTLIPALVPPGAAHIHGVTALGHASCDASVLDASAVMSSLLGDFAIRSAPKSTIPASSILRLPKPVGPAEAWLRMRTLRLNALTRDYAAIWSDAFEDCWRSDTIGGSEPADFPIAAEWTAATPLRSARLRRQAQLEIDVIVALMVGVSVDELCATYRTQFAVLFGYDRNSSYYDANGRLVPTEVLQRWRRSGDRVSTDERSAVHPGSGIEYTYELPFVTLDREADMREAYARFERLLAEQS